MATGVSTEEQKQTFGERLFPLVQHMYPGLAAKVTGMLLELDISELQKMLESKDILEAKVHEAVAVLQGHLESVSTNEQGSNISTVMATGVSTEEQKQTFGERLFPLVQRMYPGLAAKVTGMLLELDISELQKMLESKDILEAKVHEAVAVLQGHLESVSTNEQGNTSDGLITEEQRWIFGERLYPLIQRMYPVQAAKITGMLLEMDVYELQHILESNESLEAKVNEAVAILRSV